MVTQRAKHRHHGETHTDHNYNLDWLCTENSFWIEIWRQSVPLWFEIEETHAHTFIVPKCTTASVVEHSIAVRIRGILVYDLCFQLTNQPTASRSSGTVWDGGILWRTWLSNKFHRCCMCDKSSEQAGQNRFGTFLMLKKILTRTCIVWSSSISPSLAFTYGMT